MIEWIYILKKLKKIELNETIHQFINDNDHCKIVEYILDERNLVFCSKIYEQ